MKRLTPMLLLLTAMACLVPQSAGAQAESTSSENSEASLAPAIAALVQEYERAAEARPPTLPRDEADYFEAPPPGANNATVLTALSRRLARDPAVDAYVKWQLTSALSEPLVEAEQRQAARLLAVDPRYPRHPSLGQQAELDRVPRQLTEEQVTAVNKQWEARVQAAYVRAAPIMRLREALLARLPPSVPVFNLWLQELRAQAQAGWDVGDAFDAFEDAVKQWQPGASPGEVTALQERMARVVADEKRVGGTVEVYREIVVKPEGDQRTLQWGKSSPKLTRDLNRLSESMAEANAGQKR